jgi:hypothetical protein
LPKGPVGVFGDLLHLFVHIVVDRDGCSHEPKIASDGWQGNS